MPSGEDNATTTRQIGCGCADKPKGDANERLEISKQREKAIENVQQVSCGWKLHTCLMFCRFFIIPSAELSQTNSTQLNSTDQKASTTRPISSPIAR